MGSLNQSKIVSLYLKQNKNAYGSNGKKKKH